jgi:tetratricopeptide (TPR) repeat protein
VVREGLAIPRQAFVERVRVARWSRELGQILVRLGDYDEALYQLRLGLRYLGRAPHKEVVRICDQIARLYASQGKLQDAREWTEKALGLAEWLLGPDELARLLYDAGIRYCRQGASELAEECWRRGLEISRETGDLVMRARLYLNLGWRSNEAGDYALALERLEAGRDLADQCGDVACLSWIWEALAQTYRALGQEEKAAQSLAQSCDLAREAGLPGGAPHVPGDVCR